MLFFSSNFNLNVDKVIFPIVHIYKSSFLLILIYYLLSIRKKCCIIVLAGFNFRDDELLFWFEKTKNQK